ncbi:ADP-ribosylation factor-like protein 10 isoform X2 [Emydura macquarii macquarii]|uniref:ADP-ribosylation factor-like protein 10 isoform X2 n=1 Tax=Emydura macquarii macquarii TaxID=1129001 RepID=UPI00352ADD8B
MAPRGALGHLSLVLGAAVAAVGSLLFIAWRRYFRGRWGARWEPPLAAGCCAEQLGFSKQQVLVLVLGLDGAGKSSVLHYISSEAAKDRTAPTQGFNPVQVPAEGFQIDLLEVGGSQNLRFYWNQFLSQAHVLVFVVDSADGPRLPVARQELHWLLAEDPRLPLVVLANKQMCAIPARPLPCTHVRPGARRRDAQDRGSHGAQLPG